MSKFLTKVAIRVQPLTRKQGHIHPSVLRALTNQSCLAIAVQLHRMAADSTAGIM
jgi:hypothetical protein